MGSDTELLSAWLLPALVSTCLTAVRGGGSSAALSVCVSVRVFVGSVVLPGVS